MKNKGFTLIEILVVVLIIGVLAAIAVPQYQKSVEKSKASQAFLLIKAVDEAIINYHLATNDWPKSFDELDITIPPSFNGDVKFVSNNRTFGKSNEDWSLSFERIGPSLYMARISGKYKGACFTIYYPNMDGTIVCVERKSAGTPNFDPDLPPGAFCEQIMQWKYVGEDQYGRWYTSN